MTGGRTLICAPSGLGLVGGTGVSWRTHHLQTPVGSFLAVGCAPDCFGCLADFPNWTQLEEEEEEESSGLRLLAVSGPTLDWPQSV